MKKDYSEILTKIENLSKNLQNQLKENPSYTNKLITEANVNMLKALHNNILKMQNESFSSN